MPTHYSLKVIRLEDLRWKHPLIHISIPLASRSISDPASHESGTLEIQVIHESTLLPDSCIGVSAVNLADLLSVDDGAIQTGSQDELYKAVGELLQRLEMFGKVIDVLSELHPFVNIVWTLTSALYKTSRCGCSCVVPVLCSYVNALQAVKNVFQADREVIDLVRTMGEAFEFVCDVQALGKRAIGLQRSIDGLLKQNIECCIFVREYTNHGLVGRMCQADKSQKIDRFQRTLAKLKNDIDSGVNIHTAVVSMRIAHGIDKLRS
ncbi:hypothetical protein ACEPAF_8816 [Sanghuangporus sanghuang]